MLRVEVAPPRADDIVIEPMSEPLHVGDEIRLEATPKDKRGWPVYREVTWHSADPAVAVVTPHGTIAGLASGTVRITAALDDARASLVIPVLPPRVVAIDIVDPPTSVVAGRTFVLTATPVDHANNPLPRRPVVWTTSDVNVALATSEGWVAALRPGAVVLTATCEGVRASVRIGVVAEPVPLPFEPAQRPAAHRRSRRGRRRGVLAGLAIVAAGLVWLSVRPETVTDTPSGRRAAGYAAGGVGIDTATVSRVAITSRPTRALRPDSALQLVAEVRDSDGRLVPGAVVAWSSGDSAVARVDRSSGQVRGVRSGRVQIVATHGSGRDSVVITVRRRGARVPAVSSIAIAPLPPLRAGNEATLAAVVLGAKGDTLQGAELTWSSSNPQVATVEALTGVARGLEPGTTQIVARSGRDSSLAELTVVPGGAAALQILGARPMAVGEALDLRVLARDQQGGALTGMTVEWSTSDATVATVDETAGIVVAHAPGSARVTARSEDASAWIMLTVVPRPEPLATAEPDAERPRTEDAGWRSGWKRATRRCGPRTCAASGLCGGPPLRPTRTTSSGWDASSRRTEDRRPWAIATTAPRRSDSNPPRWSSACRSPGGPLREAHRAGRLPGGVRAQCGTLGDVELPDGRLSRASEPAVIVCRTLGPIEVTVDGAPAPSELLWRKHLALLVYLARSPRQTRSREHLIGLLWADRTELAARHSLSEALRVIRRHAGQEAVEVTVGHVGLTEGAVDLDVSRLEELAAQEDWTAAAELVAGEFLEGFGVPDATGFEDWLAAEREQWRRRSLEVLVRCADALARAGKTSEACGVAARAVTLEPTSEVAFRAALRSLSLADDRGGALELCERFYARLAELGLTPGEDTRALIERVRRQRGVRREVAPDGVDDLFVRPPLGGRAGELGGCSRRRPARPVAPAGAGAAGGGVGRREDAAARGDARAPPARRRVGGDGTGGRGRPGRSMERRARARAWRPDRRGRRRRGADRRARGLRGPAAGVGGPVPGRARAGGRAARAGAGGGGARGRDGAARRARGRRRPVAGRGFRALARLAAARSVRRPADAGARDGALPAAPRAR